MAMDYWKWQERVVAQIDRLLDEKADSRGGKQTLLDSLAIQRNFFSDLRRRPRDKNARIPFNVVFRIVNELDDHPIRLLYKAGREVDPDLPELDKERPSDADLPEDHQVKIFSALLGKQKCVVGSRNLSGLRGYQTWRRLISLAQSKPRDALNQGEAALKLAAEELRPRILAVLATALRRTDDLDGAFVALEIAENRADQLRDRWAIADTWQRRSYVLLAAGEPAVALHASCIASGVFISIGSVAGAGRATLAQGICLAALSRQEDAIQAFRGSLKTLPSWETDHRYSAMINIARAYCELGDHGNALKWAKGSVSDIGRGVCELVLLGSWETQGLLAFQLGSFQEAENAFRHCVDEYTERDAHLDSALSLVWLCRCLLANGKTQQCRETAQKGIRLIGHLKHHRVASGAMAYLAAEARAGRAITDELLQTVVNKVTKARGWRPIGTPPENQPPGSA